ncbi:MAG: filamentous hemagglutinin N-terminal domain-containing protein, partial [Burkholderiales bacterium]|nr:filamentous hemagglutinin N-terminal domain-containing protein [Burkholderiales bacterium]
MNTNTPKSTARRTRAAASPAVAGFRPLGLALALAAAFGAPWALAQSLPTGMQPVVGGGTLTQSGTSAQLTTSNGAGNFSAFNWQSFSIGAGHTFRIQQPGASSLSLNRVTSNIPSSIQGNFLSNGSVVLVNQAGIAVGAGAFVDTAGFTASTLKMS